MSLSILHLHDISAIAMDKPLFDDYRNNIFKSCELSQPLLVLSLLVDWRVEDAIPVDEHLLRAPELRAGEDGSGEARLEREARHLAADLRQLVVRLRHGAQQPQPSVRHDLLS